MLTLWLTILKAIINDTLANDTLSDFDVGYVQGANVVSIRSEKDLSDGGSTNSGFQRTGLHWTAALNCRWEALSPPYPVFNRLFQHFKDFINSDILFATKW